MLLPAGATVRDRQEHESIDQPTHLSLKPIG